MSSLLLSLLVLFSLPLDIYAEGNTGIEPTISSSDLLYSLAIPSFLAGVAILLIAKLFAYCNKSAYTTFSIPCTMGPSNQNVSYCGTLPKKISSITQHLKNKPLAQKLNIPMPRGILLYGPPGCWKTHLARYIADTVQCPFIALNGADARQTFIGQSEEWIKAVFNTARKAAYKSKSKMAIIFIDEIDALAEERMSIFGSSSNALHVLLTEMDGFHLDTKITIVVIGATNRVEALDEAIMRSGRFDYKIHVKLPKEGVRKAFIEHYMTIYPSNNDITVDSLVELTAGKSPADIKFIFEDAGRNALCQGKAIRDKECFAYAFCAMQRALLKKNIVTKQKQREELLGPYIDGVIRAGICINPQDCYSEINTLSAPEIEYVGQRWLKKLSHNKENDALHAFHEVVDSVRDKKIETCLLKEIQICDILYNKRLERKELANIKGLKTHNIIELYAP
jgi:SpoVK/Ycf46/Vps4 family AAA+-type ATPase